MTPEQPADATMVEIVASAVFEHTDANREQARIAAQAALAAIREHHVIIRKDLIEDQELGEDYDGTQHDGEKHA